MERADSMITVDTQEQIKSLVEKSLELIPNMPEAIMQMGKMYYKTSASEEGNMEKAIDDFSESIRLNPAHIRSLLMRGNAYLGLGEKDKAKADLDEYLRCKRFIEKIAP